MILGEKWDPSSPPKVFTSEDGRQITIEVFEYGLKISDEGGTTQVPHIDEIDANTILLAGRKFRAAP